MSDETTGWAMNLILAERKRQVEEEGYTASHDDRHTPQELEGAARAYLIALDDGDGVPYTWPWSDDAWKPKSRLRNLVRAGALYLAASDLVNRSGASHRAQYFDRQADLVADTIERECDRPDDE